MPTATRERRENEREMAATGDEEVEIESLLSNFHQIYEDFSNAVKEIESLKSSCNAEIKRREALQFTCEGLKLDNERLTKAYTGSLNKFADQLENHTNFQSLREELERVKDESLHKEDEHRNFMKLLKQDYAAKIGDLENQIRFFQLQKAVNEETISRLQQDLAEHRSHIESLASRLEHVRFDVESQYHHDIQDLKDCLMAEQEEKNELNRKLQELERELLMSRAKLVEQQQGLTSNQNVETLKQKIMKLRREKEVLRRQLHDRDA